MENKLAPVPEGKEFILSSGKKIVSIEELYSVLKELDSKTFKNHVTKEKNDFANWVRGVQKDYVLANSLNPLMNRESCLEAVADHIYSLKKGSEVLDPKQHVKQIQKKIYEEDSLENMVSDIKANVHNTLLLPNGGDDLIEFAEKDIIKDSLKTKAKKVKDFVDLPGFKEDMKKVFRRKVLDNKPHIDDLKRACLNDEK